MTNRGFSLIEVIAAMIILSVGIIGLAASTTAIQNMTQQGGMTSGSASVAAARFDVLRSTPCASMASGTATTGKFRESWTVTTVNQLRTVADTITFIANRRTRTVGFTSAISCIGPSK